MKITFVMTAPTLGGGTRVIAAHAQQLLRAGHEVNVVSVPERPATAPARLRRLVRGDHTTNGPVQLLEDAGVPHRRLTRFRAVRDRDLPDADVVIATWWETGHWVAELARRKGRKVQFFQHYEACLSDPDSVDAAWRLPMRKLVVSTWLQRLARERFGDEHAAVVPNGIAADVFDAAPRARNTEPCVGFVYSGVAFKGTDTVVGAINAARTRLPSLGVESFGLSVPDRSLPDGTHFSHQPPRNALSAIYARCDAWLCGSTTEGFGLPLLEAMACYCPVISTRCGGPEDFITDGSEGLLVEVADPDAMAERILGLMSCAPEIWAQMSHRAYERAHAYTWADASALFIAAIR